MSKPPPKPATSVNGRYGLFDTVDKCWMGNEKGPVRYDDWDLARMAALVASEQLGWSHKRIRAAGFVDDKMILVDEVSTLLTPLEAIQRLEKK